MTKDLNRVQLLGHVGVEPELRYLDTGAALATFSVATNRRWKDATGEEHDETEWSRIVAWNRLGEIVGQFLHTGARVYLEGRLRTHAWDDGQTGVRRTATEVVADELMLLDGRGRPGAADQDDTAVLGATGATHAADLPASAKEPAGGAPLQPSQAPRLRVQPRARLLVAASQKAGKAPSG